MTKEECEKLNYIRGAIDVLLDMAKDRKATSSERAVKAVVRFQRGEDKNDHDVYYHSGQFDAWNELERVIKNSLRTINQLEKDHENRDIRKDN